ncbi:PREDICTED: uncharacterized protein LOC106747637 [Dinoponera quadriceps]|uniref:Uncharacterized protein LOC106747637 n=1 Tax=Dinoponera quadriceps TaxID=609295 RepID=A0A6P3XSG9_DINQU|nr:PREDICTED: uncharacterized protein LOC106747637 [Dinoponera quadriceps]
MEHSRDSNCVDSEYESDSLETMEAHEKRPTKTIRPFWETDWKMAWDMSYNEIYAIIRAILLVFSIFYWCYYSLQYGPREFTILENEQVLPGFVFSKKAIIAFSYGYSNWNSIIYAISAIMMIYSIIWVSEIINRIALYPTELHISNNPFRNGRYLVYLSWVFS